MPEQITDEMRAAVNRRAAVNKAITELTKAQAAKRRGVNADPIMGEWHEVACDALSRVDADEMRRVLAELSDEYTKEKEKEPEPAQRSPQVAAPTPLIDPFGP
jgi:hypothetical protein